MTTNSYSLLWLCLKNCTYIKKWMKKEIKKSRNLLVSKKPNNNKIVIILIKVMKKMKQ